MKTLFALIVLLIVVSITSPLPATSCAVRPLPVSHSKGFAVWQWTGTPVISGLMAPKSLMRSSTRR